MGTKNDYAMFDEDGWKFFFRYQDVITNYLNSNNTNAVTINSEGFAITFEQMSFSRVIKIWKDDSYIYLG